MAGGLFLAGRLLRPRAPHQARAAVAALIGADTADVVLVDNASFGINAILRSVPLFLKRKSLFYLDHAYFVVKTAMRLMAGLLPGGDSGPDRCACVCTRARGVARWVGAAGLGGAQG